MSEKKEVLNEVSHATSAPTIQPTDRSDNGNDEKREDDFEQRLAGLPEKYREEILKQYDVPNTQVTLFAVLRYATWFEKTLMVVGSLTSMASGAAMPLTTVILGNLTNVFGDFGSGGSSSSSTPLTAEQFKHLVSHFALQFVYLGIGIMAASYTGTFFWTLAGERVSRRIRGFTLLPSLLIAGNISRPFYVKMSPISIGLVRVKSPIGSPTTLNLFEKVFLIRYMLSTYVS